MVTGLGQEGATAYRSLNYQRERLVEGRVKVFFWLTGEEVRSMANLAPDFWAMKHRIIDFPEAAGDEQVSTAYQAAFSFISQTHFESGEELAGMIATREAILEGLRPGNTVERRDVLVTLGGLYYHSGRYSDAEATLVKALKLSQRRKRIDVVSTITHNPGALFLAQGRLEEALDHLTKSMEISESLGDQRGISESLHELGALAQKQGRLEESLNYSTRSLEISEDLGEQEGIAVSLYELGALAQKQGRLDEALDYCNKSLDIFYKLGDPQGILYSLHVWAAWPMTREDWRKPSITTPEARRSQKTWGNSGVSRITSASWAY
jgi:tetratricopeptide (TPR) repeat protein